MEGLVALGDQEVKVALGFLDAQVYQELEAEGYACTYMYMYIKEQLRHHQSYHVGQHW